MYLVMLALIGCRCNMLSWKVTYTVHRIGYKISTMHICCMKPYNIKGAAMPTYAILAEYWQSSCMAKSSYLPRPIIPHQTVCSWIGRDDLALSSDQVNLKSSSPFFSERCRVSSPCDRLYREV